MEKQNKRKYAFDEKELLGLFLAVYADPYLKDGYVCATNGYSLIRVKANVLSGEYAPTDKMDLLIPEDNCDYLITDKDIEEAFAGVPHEEEIRKISDEVECPECGGYGVVDWEYTDRKGNFYNYEHDCPVCKGRGSIGGETEKTGRMIPDRYASIGVGNNCLKAEEVQILLDAMKLIGVTEVHLVAQEERLSVFRMDENISVIIANYRRPADYTIAMKEGGSNE